MRSNHPALRAISTNKPITIVLLLVNEADVPSHVLSKAQDEASRIYQSHGIRLVWTNPDTERGDYRFTVKIVPTRKSIRSSIGIPPENVTPRASSNRCAGGRTPMSLRTSSLRVLNGDDDLKCGDDRASRLVCVAARTCVPTRGTRWLRRGQAARRS